MDFEYKAQFEELEESFIREHKDSLPWYLVCQFQVLTEDFMREMEDYLDYFQISQFQVLSDVFIRDYAEQLNWTALCMFQQLPESVLRDYPDKINWGYISQYQVLSNDFIRDFKEELDWTQICVYQTLSEADILEFHDYIDPSAVSTYQRLTDTIIREHRDRLDWIAICTNQVLSPEILADPDLLPFFHWESLQIYQSLPEDFVRANLTRLNNLSYQLNNLSLTFIKNFSRAFDIYYCLENFRFPTSVLSEFRHLVSDFWFIVSRFQVLDTDFIRYFARELTWSELSIYQMLEEELMTDYYSRLDIDNIWIYQSYSDQFILDHLDDANWNTISYNRLITHPSLVSNVIADNNWLYLPTQSKIDALTAAGYTIITNPANASFAVTYKILNKNMQTYDFNHWYSFEVGQTLTTVCNFNSTVEQSTGIQMNRLGAIQALYVTGKIVRGVVPLEKIVLLEDGSVRCSEVLINAEVTISGN